MAAAIPGASFVAIDGAGHVPTGTHPAEVVAAIEAKFAPTQDEPPAYSRPLAEERDA